MLTRTLLPLALVATLGLTGCSKEDGETASDPNTSSPTPTETTSPTESESSDAGECAYVEDAMGAAKKVDLPPATPKIGAQEDVTLTLGQGKVKATLDGKGAPCTVNSFVSLAEQGYFDNTTCHRLTTAGILVLQCGDPTGTGAGGPGYQFDDELDTAQALEANPAGGVVYPPGTLAMANAGPGTNGSQFFIVYGPSPLAPSYTVFGKVDPASLKVVKKIGAAGTDSGQPDGAPKNPVKISQVTVG